MSQQNQQLTPLVLDIGSGRLKAGFSGDEKPKLDFESVVGRPRHSFAMVGAGHKSAYVGDESQEYRGMMTMKYPVERGIVKNWEDWEQLLHYTYRDLHVAPEDHAALFTVPLYNPLANEEKIAETMFEVFNVPAVAGALTPALDHYASGRCSGLVVSIGEGLTQILPIYESSLIEHAMKRVDTGGRDLTQYLARMLTEKSASQINPPSSVYEDISAMKQRCCYVAQDFETEMNDFSDSTLRHMTYTFVDGKTHTLSAERIRVSEAIFKPALLGLEQLGLHHLVYESLLRCPLDIRKDLACNIILAGGSTLLPGLGSRLQAELTSLLPQSLRVQVLSSPNRAQYSWIGGSIVSSLSTFQYLWFSKAEYEEKGTRGIHTHGLLQTIKDDPRF